MTGPIIRQYGIVPRPLRESQELEPSRLSPETKISPSGTMVSTSPEVCSLGPSVSEVRHSVSYTKPSGCSSLYMVITPSLTVTRSPGKAMTRLMIYWSLTLDGRVHVIGFDTP